MHIPMWSTAILVLVGGLQAVGPMAWAGGFAVPDQSPSSAARAAVGTAAGVDDASTLFYNPASLTSRSRVEGLSAVGIVFPSIRFSDAGSRDALGGAMQGTESVLAQTWYIPSIFLTWPIVQSRLQAGVGVTSPFGQSIAYEPGWRGRYFLTDARLRTIEVAFAVGWKATPEWSVGGALKAQRASLQRASAIDFGSICFAAVGPAGCVPPALIPQRADGRLRIDTDGSALGYDFGVVHEDRDKALRIGMVYRSAVRQHLRGDADFDVPAAALSLVGGRFRDTGVNGILTLPESINFGVDYRISDEVRGIFGASWTRWSRISTITATFENPLQPPLTEVLGWRNRTRIGFAFEFLAAEQWRLVGGIAWDPTPVPSSNIPPFLPEGNRTVIGAGATWRSPTGLAVTVSYTGSWSREVQIRQEQFTAGSLVGTYSNRINGVGLSANLPL